MPAPAPFPQTPNLVPAPQHLQVLDGAVTPGQPLRLVPDNAASGLQDTVASILKDAGLDLSGAFPIELSITQELNLKEVPDAARDEYYELDLGPGAACIRAPGPQGLRWAAHTLAALWQAENDLPLLRIRDWPDLPNRGIFVENKWGPDRMSLPDWKTVIDRLAALKMNRMGVGLYGCWGNCRYENAPTEFLMVSIPGHPELKNEHTLRWYSPAASQWRTDTYRPALSEEDCLGDIVAYGKDKGVAVIPFINSLGHNTFIPRMLPEISAKAEDGTPLGIGYCLSSDKTRAFIETFYGSVLDRYFPNGADFFHIQLDEVWPDNPDLEDATKRVDPWCRCPDCRTREREQNLQNYIVWLVQMLTRKGIKKVIMWNDQLTRHMDALDDSFLGKLKDAGLADRLILHWWWYSNEALNDKTRVSIGKKLGLPGWVAPMTCYFNWERYHTTFPNIELMLTMAHEEGAEGAVSYAVHDPAWTDHEMLMAGYAWNFAAVHSRDAQRETWAAARFGANAPRFLDALAALQQAAASPVSACYYYAYSYARPNLPYPRRYPEEALNKLEEIEHAPPRLRDAAETARAAATGFESLTLSGLRPADLACIRSLRGEAARIEGLAKTFAYLLDARWAVSKEKVDDSLLAAGRHMRSALISAMAVMETEKPAYVVPACLQALSILLEFLDQLLAQLEEVRNESRNSAEVQWHLSPNT